MDIKKTYSISELAKEFDVTTRSIRFYEDQGLLQPLPARANPDLQLKGSGAAEADPPGQTHGLFPGGNQRAV